MLPGFLENFLESGNSSAVLRPRRKPHWVSSNFGSITFTASWHPAFLRRLAKRQLVVGSFTPLSRFVYEDDQFANLSAPFQNAMPLDTHGQGRIKGGNGGNCPGHCFKGDPVIKFVGFK